MKQLALLFLLLSLPVWSADQSASSQEAIASISFTPTSLVLKTPEGERQLVQAELETAGLKDAKCRIVSPDWPIALEISFGDLPAGKRQFEFDMRPSEKPVDVSIVSSTERREFKNIVIEPPKHMAINLVQHVHTDIGYTRPQTEILPDHLRYIDYALDYCDLTDDYPDDAKFRWTCEISWAVREYLQRRPADQIERLKKRVKEGRIEIAGMFLNMAEIADESALAASLQPLHTIEKDYGFPVKTAMQNDVNGAGWCLVDYFSGMGIEYLTMGINKTRSLLPFDRPTCFWWESPSGKRIMVHRSDHYHTGNFLQLHTGNVDAVKTRMIDYLGQLKDGNYPFDHIAVKFSGYHTDNSPPATVECDVVKQWNEKYAWPHLRIATAHEFLDYMKENHGDELAVHRQAWPDWWTDGFGSAARETGASRDTHVAMQITQTLLAMASSLGGDLRPEVMNRVDHVQEQLLFYDEHTYGAAESISDPMAENSMVQWGEKSSYAWEAVKTSALLREEAMGLMQDFVPRFDQASIAIFNTLNWNRSGLVEVFIDHEILPLDKGYRIVDCESGAVVASQMLRNRSEGAYWALWVNDVPALGYKMLRIEAGSESSVSESASDISRLENDFYSLTIDPANGSISSLIDKTTGRELVDLGQPWNVGQFIYEMIPGVNGASPSRDFSVDGFRRTSLYNVEIQREANGPIWQSLVIQGDADGCAEKNALRCEIRLYETEKRIEFHYAIRKKPITDPEAVYIAFPFQLPDSHIVYEAQGGIVQPGKDQIPRSSSDWQTVQNFISIRNRDGQIVVVPDQAPLVQFGDINLGKWQETLSIERPHFYSWIMNNYWFTNFRASQEGEFKWDYSITTTADTNNVVATRFGWGSRVPLTSRVLPPVRGGRNTDRPVSRSILPSESTNLLFIDARPARYGKGVVFQIREIGGQEASFEGNTDEGDGNLVEVNVLEDALGDPSSKITFLPFETKFVKLME